MLCTEFLMSLSECKEEGFERISKSIKEYFNINIDSYFKDTKFQLKIKKVLIKEINNDYENLKIEKRENKNKKTRR